MVFRRDQVCAMGGLVLYLLNSSIFSQLEADRLMEPICIRSLQSIPDGDVLQVDGATLDSLGMVMAEAHPAAVGGGGARRGKEGFSVYSTINHTKTLSGGRMLKHWLMFPSTDLDTIRHRQDHVEYFVRPANSVSRWSMISSSVSCANISRNRGFVA